ncbi:MAG: hypothetical protein ACRER5_10160, partial [Pseudomonas sp.]
SSLRKKRQNRQTFRFAQVIDPEGMSCGRIFTKPEIRSEMAEISQVARAAAADGDGLDVRSQTLGSAGYAALHLDPSRRPRRVAAHMGP